MAYFAPDDPLADLAGGPDLLSFSGSPSFAPGVVGLAFDSGYSAPSEIDVLQSRSRVSGLDSYPYSISALVKTEDVSSAFNTVLCLQNGYFDVPQGVGVRNGHLTLRDSQTAYYQAPDAFVSDGQWHHVCAVFSSNLIGGKKLYLDGSLVWTSTSVSQPFVDNQFSGTDNDYEAVTIGGNWRWRQYDPYDDIRAHLDSLRLYARELSQAEISTLAGEVP